MGTTNYTNTLAGMLMLNDQNMADIYPTNVCNQAPVVERAIAVKASSGGTQHKYLRKLTAPGVGFRKLNTGVTNAAGTFEDITHNLELLDGSFTRDCGLADAYRGGRDAYMRNETLTSLQELMFAIEKAIFRFDQSTQFIGLPYMVEYADTDYATPSQIVSAGGAGGKSVWLLRWAEDGVALVAGNEGKLSMSWDADNPSIVRVTDAGGTNVYSAYLNTLLGWVGLQVGSVYDVVRICNLDGTSDDLLDDDLLAEALMKFPMGHRPNMIVMNRTANLELWKSRTAVNPTGKEADQPTEFQGIPIVLTDALPTTEDTVSDVTTTTTTSTSV